MTDAVNLIKSTRCLSLLSIELQSNPNEVNLVDLSKCNSVYNTTQIDPQTQQLTKVTVDLKCFPAV